VSASVVLASECPPDDPGFCAPSVLEFFPKPLATFDLFGVHFAITRITVILWIATALMVWFFIAATRNMQLVPGKRQYFAESGYSIIRDGVAREVIGTEGLRFAPYLASLFFFILINNIMGIIPFAQIPPTGRFAFPVVLAAITYVLFNWVGIRQQGVGPYFKNNLFPPACPSRSTCWSRPSSSPRRSCSARSRSRSGCSPTCSPGTCCWRSSRPALSTCSPSETSR